MTTYSAMHILLGDESTDVGIEGEGRTRLVIVEDGPAGRHHLALTFWNVPTVDRVMAALAEVRDNLNRPANAVPVRHAAMAGGGPG
jgi:hypothetical protein